MVTDRNGSVSVCNSTMIFTKYGSKFRKVFMIEKVKNKA